MKKKSIALLIAFALVVGAAIGGTLAWLTASSDQVVNTFTTSNINITLEEDEGGQNHTFKMVPGYTIDKDPKVTVEAGSEESYLFVKLVESENFRDFLTYSVAEGWTQLKDNDNNNVSGVYYRSVETDSMGTAFSVLSNDQVKVNETVTKEGMTSDDFSNPTLAVTAYATQLYKANNIQFEPYEAWEKVYSTGSTD